MKAYLLTNTEHDLDEALTELLRADSLDVEEIELPANHEVIHDLFREKEPGIVFMPPIWEDLLSVKIINELQITSRPYETVIVGEVPDMQHLIVAFNNGLGAYLPSLDDAAKVNMTVNRMRERLKRRFHVIHLENRLREYEGGGTSSVFFSPQVIERDHYLAQALMDALKDRGPIVEGRASILLVSASTVQQKRLAKFLGEFGVLVKMAGNIAEGMSLAVQSEVRVIVADSVLPDGEATKFVNQLRKQLKNEMPRFIVWTSSPEKAGDLLKPENHIDDVIVKPGPEMGMEAVLPTIVAGIYQSLR